MSSFFGFLFTMNTILLVLLAITFPFTAPGSSARAISYLSFAIILASLTGLTLFSAWRGRRSSDTDDSGTT
ncbi:hypothetical protein [Haloprofundus halobius]|uniref:hypothetical protein n=1 Tax=Haloprofundus halobius TaxID=2876194 RepID=UPI001CC95EFA|nr:hypothetical protein [Haloprofundus halobius]